MLFQFYISSVALVLQFLFILVSSRLIYFQLYGTADVLLRNCFLTALVQHNNNKANTTT